MEIKLEENVPLPDDIAFRGKIGKWTKLISQAKDGDSFVAPSKCYQTIQTTARRLGRRLVQRKLDQNNTRFWIVKKENNENL